MELARNNAVDLRLSREFLEDAADVLNRASTRAQFKTLTDAMVTASLDSMAGFSQQMTGAIDRLFKMRRDPKDAYVINLAAAVNASVLVTRDKDLLALPQDTGPDGELYRSLFASIRTMDPVIFLRWMADRM
jgi:putative PIN family toxin of toxin-antitoxin system